MRTISRLAGLAFLCLLSASLPARAAGDAQTYYLLVFGAPPTGKDKAYTDWNDQYIKDILAVPGFVSAQRLRYSEAQMTPESLRLKKDKRDEDWISRAKQTRPYGVAYKVITPDLHTTYAEVHRREKAQLIGKPPVGTSLINYTYHVTSPKMTEPTPTFPLGVVPKDYYVFVFNTPLPGREAEYNAWYESHERGMISHGDIYTGERMTLNDEQFTDTPVISKSLILYEMRTPDAAGKFKASQERMEAGLKDPHPTNNDADFPYDTTRDFNLTYEWDGPIIMAPGH